MRLFLEFAFSYTDGGPWSDAGIDSMARFVKRVETLVDKVLALSEGIQEPCARHRRLYDDRRRQFPILER